MNRIKDLNREKARFALCYVNKIIEEAKEKADNKGRVDKKFRSHIKNIPMYIYTNGLIATLAFIMKKSNSGGLESESYKNIGEIIREYFQSDSCLKSLESNEFVDLIHKLINMSSKEYRLFTLDLLSFFEWIVKFSEGLIENEKE